MASLMDVIMQNRAKSPMRALPMNAPFGGLGGASEAMTGNMVARPPMLMGAPNPMLSAPQFQNPMMTNMEPGYSGAAGAMVPTAAEAARPSLPGRTPGFLDQLLSGTDYQSNSMPVDIRAQGPSMPGQQMPLESINFGDPNNAADFFRADKLLMQNPGVPGFLGGFGYG